MKYENYGVATTEAKARKRAGIVREPLRTTQEMAAELGLTSARLAALLSHRGGPAPALKRKPQTIAGRVATVSWYRPSVVREWFAANCQDVKGRA